MAEYLGILVTRANSGLIRKRKRQRKRKRYNGFVRTRLRMRWRLRIGFHIQAIRSVSARPFTHTNQRGAFF
jgi:hypothetical protein